MANQEHLDIFKQGVEAWNNWRKKHFVEVDLSHAQLVEADLSYADLFQVNLLKADLSRANLKGVNLSYANLTGADLKGTSLSQADLSGANLSQANLTAAHLFGADLSQADLSGANLLKADLTTADLRGADFYGANLSEANLSSVILRGADLRGADLSEALMGNTIFGNLDLSEVKRLETVRHLGPSTIGIDTIYHSKGMIPEAFLRGAGIPDTFITYARSLIVQPIEYYTCFISYSSHDQVFAERLYADLQNKGVRCWFAPEDLKIGDKIRPRIDESILLYDKLLLVLSQYAVASQWIEQEVETALEKERKEKRIVLFPIRLDKAVMELEGGWPALIRNTRNIGDFTRWKRHDAYQKAFERLIGDLKAEALRPEV